jgi:Ca2+-binding EF-hand superfamily protein
MAAKQEIRHGHLNRFGQARAGLEDEIDSVNTEFEDRAEKDELVKYKAKFLQIDSDGSGDLDSFELLNFLNSCGVKDGGKAWTEPKIKSEVIKKYGVSGAQTLRYRGFLTMLLGAEMGRVLRLKLKFENLAVEASKPISSQPKKLW